MCCMCNGAQNVAAAISLQPVAPVSGCLAAHDAVTFLDITNCTTNVSTTSCHAAGQMKGSPT